MGNLRVEKERTAHYPNYLKGFPDFMRAASFVRILIITFREQ